MSRRLSRRRVALLLLLLLPVAAAAGGWAWYRKTYPYGWSHSCDVGLMFALQHYADDHGGAYPAGGATPEASLSLLYPKYANEYLLQGKTVPVGAVKATLDRDGRLGPETCGWHYVEGLTTHDHGAALFWDKAGLGHNGERLRDGGHTVIFVEGNIRHINDADWSGFLREQEALLKERAGRGAR